MNAEFVAVRVQNNRCPAAWHVERLNGERHVVASQMVYRLVEVVHFQSKVGTVAGWLQEWFIANTERVRTDLILHIELAAVIDRSRAGEPQNALIKAPGTCLVCGWIYDEGKFEDSH